MIDPHSPRQRKAGFMATPQYQPNQCDDQSTMRLVQYIPIYIGRLAPGPVFGGLSPRAEKLSPPAIFI